MADPAPLAVTKNPMPPSPANDVYRVRVIGSIEQQLTVNTLYYADEAPIGGAGMADEEDVFTTFTGPNGPWANWLAVMSVGWTCTYITVDTPTVPELATFTGFPANTAGVIPGGHTPTQIAAVIAKTTFWRGQHGRGRISLPGVPLSSVTNSQISAIVPYQTLATSLNLSMTGANTTYHPGVLSIGPGPTYEYGWVITSKWLARGVVGTIRRRKLGVGK